MQEDFSTIGADAQSVQVFDSPEFGRVRTYIGQDGTVLFCAKDVCDCLGYSNSRKAISDHCKGVTKRYPLQTPGGIQEAVFITQPDLLRLIARSKLPNAQKFEAWMFEEVMPSVVNHGGYIAGQEQMAPEQLCLAAMEYLQSRVKQLEADNAMQGKVIAKNTAKIDRMRPKALFADAVAASDSTILIGDLAKIIKQSCGVDTGQKRLFAWMRENGWLMKDGSSKNMPTQRAMDMGLFRVKETTISNPDGSVRVTKTTKVTGKGQQFFVNKFAEAGEVVAS